MAFVGIARPEEFRIVTRAHIIAWRKDLERRQLSATTIGENFLPWRRSSITSAKKCSDP
jgi:hypothetical protein